MIFFNDSGRQAIQGVLGCASQEIFLCFGRAVICVKERCEFEAVD